MTLKLYAYVDESWHGRHRDTIVVGVVVTQGEQEGYYALCEQAEGETGKRTKWTKTRPHVKLSYLQRVFAGPLFRGRLYYEIFPTTERYQTLIARTIAAALRSVAQGEDGRATVLVDALSRKDETQVSRLLRQLGVKVRKVRGVRRDESDALIRLADSLCGLVRATIDGDQALSHVLALAIARGIITQVQVAQE